MAIWEYREREERMKKFDPNLTKLLEQYKNEDGTVDYEKVSNHITEDVTKYHQSQLPKMEDLEAQARDNAINTFIKDLGFENVDQYKADVNRMKASSDELTEANKRLESELNKYKEDYTSLETQHNELNSKLTRIEKQSTVGEVGFNPKYNKAVMVEVDELIAQAKEKGEELDLRTAAEKVKENYPEWATEFKPNKGNEIEKGDTEVKTDEEELNSFRGLINL